MKTARTILFTVVLCAALSGAVLFLLYRHYQTSISTLQSSLPGYLSAIKEVQQKIEQNTPTYDDFATIENEQKLRRHLLMDHLAVARELRLSPIKNHEEAQKLAARGDLVPVTRDGHFYFYGLAEKNRFLTPATLAGLHEITRRLNQKIFQVSGVTVKLALSSALRPVDYQESLKTININAANESSHSFGISFDIFFDDFFIVLPELPGGPAWGPAGEKIKSALGFMLGDALRRQLRTELARTLMTMQDEGILFAILEKNQKCYHVTIRPSTSLKK